MSTSNQPQPPVSTDTSSRSPPRSPPRTQRTPNAATPGSTSADAALPRPPAAEQAAAEQAVAEQAAGSSNIEDMAKRVEQRRKVTRTAPNPPPIVNSKISLDNFLQENADFVPEGESKGESKQDLSSHEIEQQQSSFENFLPKLLECTRKRWNRIGICKLWAGEFKGVLKRATSRKIDGGTATTLYRWDSDARLWVKAETSADFFRLSFHAMLLQHLNKFEEYIESNPEEDEEGSLRKDFDWLNQNFNKLVSLPPDFNAMDIEACEHDMNATADELPIRGGRIIDLKTCNIRIRNPTDLWSFELDVDYVQDGWNKKMEYILKLCNGDIEYMHFMLRLLGYCLLRKPSRHFFIFLGESRRGKSTLLDFVFRIMSSSMVCKIQESDRGIFTGSANSLYESDIFDSRMSYSDDDRAGRTLRDDLKQKTSGVAEPIRGRRQRQEYKTWSTTLIYCANFMPKINDDPALKNRLIVVPFLAEQFSIDDDFMEELHCQESKNAMFSLMCRGAMNLMKCCGTNKFLEKDKLPEIVKVATDTNYQQGIGSFLPANISVRTSAAQQDKYTLAEQWYNECCKRVPGENLQWSKLINHYKAWSGNRPKLKFCPQSNELKKFIIQKGHECFKPTVGDHRNTIHFRNLQLKQTQ